MVQLLPVNGWVVRGAHELVRHRPGGGAQERNRHDTSRRTGSCRRLGTLVRTEVTPPSQAACWCQGILTARFDCVFDRQGAKGHPHTRLHSCSLPPLASSCCLCCGETHVRAAVHVWHSRDPGHVLKAQAASRA